MLEVRQTGSIGLRAGAEWVDCADCGSCIAADGEIEFRDLNESVQASSAECMKLLLHIPSPLKVGSGACVLFA